jgi:hypothetical protein
MRQAISDSLHASSPSHPSMSETIRSPFAPVGYDIYEAQVGPKPKPSKFVKLCIKASCGHP